MRLTSLHIPSEHIRLDDLSPGLNVVFAPEGRLRRAVPNAVRTALFGSTADDLASCRLGLQSPWGGFQATYSGDEAGTHITDAQGFDRTRWLLEKLSSLADESYFAAIHIPRLSDLLSLDAAMSEVCGDEFARQQRDQLESLLRELDESRPWQGREGRVAELRAREARLVAKLEQLHATPAHAGCNHGCRTELSERIGRCQERLRRLQQRLAAIDARLRNPPVIRTRRVPDAQVQGRLDRTSRQIERLEHVLEDLRRRSQQLQERGKVEVTRDVPAADALYARYAQLLRLLTRHARRLESHIASLASQPVADELWADSVARLVPRLHQLNEKLTRLCDRLRAHRQPHLTTPASAAAHEQELLQVRQCQRTLNDRLAALLQRRNALRRELDQTREAIEVAGDHSTQQRVRRERQRIEARIHRGQARLRRLEHQLAAHRCHDAPRPQNDQQPLEAELSEVRAQLAQLSVDEQRQTNGVLERLRTFLYERPTPAVLAEASNLLRQLTEGELLGIRPGTSGREVIVEQPRGRTVTCDVLSRAERVHVHLALCLAAAADATRRGVSFPLILNDATRYFPPARLRMVIELLRGFCRASGQVILLTSQQHVATLCRSLGAASYWLGRATSESAYIVSPEHEPAAPARPVPPAFTSVHESAWDCEEFPGELRDRVRGDEFGQAYQPISHSTDPTTNLEHGDAPVSPARPAAPGPVDAGHPRRSGRPAASASRTQTELDGFPHEVLRGTGHYLELCDRVTEIPFLARRVSKDAESSGIYTVANFLHADPAWLAERLTIHGVSAAEVRRWQGQARLMCGVRRLRGYDAKILAACGVTTPEQLADIRPHELYEMIEAFVATPEGSRVVRSGNDYEISRITRWIRAVQHARRGREFQPTPPASRPDSHRREPQPPRQPRAASRPSDHHPSPQVQTPVPKRTRRKLEKVNGQPRVVALRFHLNADSHVEAAPSIGPAMARRLEGIGIATVAQLLAADPEETARQLKQRRVAAETVRSWQRQAALVCRIPELRGHDAQILVSCGIHDPKRLAAMEPAELHRLIMPFVKTKEGKRVLRNGQEPSLEEVGHWIAWAKHARKLQAA